MALQKLENVNAFVVRDLDDETPAIGIVRSANKILQGGAKDLARSQTYQCAVLGMQLQGASCGVSAPPEERDAAIASFSDEVMGAVESGGLMLDAAKGIRPEQLSALSAVDGRSELRLAESNGMTTRDHLTGAGAVAAAGAVRSLDGAKIAVENFDAVGLAVAQAAVAAGATVTAVSTADGAALNDQGFSIDDLASGLAEHGAGLVAQLSDEELPFWRIIGANVDVLFAGSKMGLIDHKNCENVKASVLVPTGPIPYTTKGALTLERQGVTVLPDFVTTAGGLLSGFPEDGDDQQAAVSGRIGDLVESILGKESSPILEACFQSEAFLKTWRDELPFGRPFAA